MSVRVELDELRERVAEYGSVAYLVTVGEDGRPHVVSVKVGLDGDALAAPAGRTTTANARARPDVTLLWPSRGDYALIVDGTARVDDERVLVEPLRAVLHRVASAPDDVPSCVTVLDRRAER